MLGLNKNAPTDNVTIVYVLSLVYHRYRLKKRVALAIY